jgi:RND family efflux transporter MFP subunit
MIGPGPTSSQNTRIQPGRLARNRALLSVTALALAAFALGCGGQPAALRRDPRATAVRTVVLKPVAIPNSSEYLGTLKSRRSTALNPEVEGQVTDIFVKSGDRVKAGTPLMQIYPLVQQASLQSQEAARAAQQANVEYAETQWNREKQLYEAGVVSKQEYDQARTALDAARQQLRSLGEQVNAQQVQLHYYRVTAPTEGVVGDIPVHVGDRVTVSTLLTTIDQPGRLELYVNVPVERSPELRLGRTVQLLDDSGKVEAESKIDFISPEVSTDTQSILAKATFANRSGTLRTAQYARARIIWSVQEGLTVPVLSVSRINGQFFVFVVERSGKMLVARQRLVQLGDLVGNDYPVLEGLKAGEHLVVEGSQELIDGAPVAETVQGG